MIKIASLFILFFLCIIANGQNKQKTIVVISEKDSVELLNTDKNLFFKFFFVENIKYNKQQIKKKLAGGYIVCEKCKKENYTVSVIQIKKTNLNLKEMSVNDFLYKKNGYADYIIFKKKYYKYNGRVME